MLQSLVRGNRGWSLFKNLNKNGKILVLMALTGSALSIFGCYEQNVASSQETQASKSSKTIWKLYNTLQYALLFHQKFKKPCDDVHSQGDQIRRLQLI